jgi:hypothetical protein
VGSCGIHTSSEVEEEEEEEEGEKGVEELISTIQCSQLIC